MKRTRTFTVTIEEIGPPRMTAELALDLLRAPPDDAAPRPTLTDRVLAALRAVPHPRTKGSR